MDAAAEQNCLLSGCVCVCVCVCHKHASNGEVWREILPKHSFLADALYKLYINRSHHFRGRGLGGNHMLRSRERKSFFHFSAMAVQY